MAPLTEEEKKRIQEEEEIRVKVRIKYEQKSSGVAGTLSSICPGLGQMYNGQLWKASMYFSAVFVSLVLLVAGIMFLIRGTPSDIRTPLVFEETEIQMTEDGVISDPDMDRYGDGHSGEDIPKLPVALIIIGLLGIVTGRNYAIKDAVKTAKRLNTSA